MPSTLPHITLDTSPNPQHSIIWLHGLGADGEDFVPLAHEIKLPVAVRYIFPHAPMQAVTINNGYVMRAWYDIYAPAANAEFSAGLTWHQDEKGIRASQLEIEKLIVQEKQRGIAAENIYLAGFSQGGAVILHTGLRHTERLGGILALSAYLPLAEKLSYEASNVAQQVPIFMAHGHSDPIVPYQLGTLSRDKMRHAGCTVEWHEYHMPHSLCDAEVLDIENWLSRMLQS